MLFRALVVLALTTFSTPGAQAPPKQNPPVGQTKRAGTENNDAEQIHKPSGNAAPSLAKENRPPEQTDREAARANAKNDQGDYHEGDTSGVWMVLLTGGLVLVGGGQALILWRQTRIINESLGVSRDTAQAAKTSAEALINAERAWVIVRKVSPVSLTAELGGSEFSFVFTNKGKTVASVVRPK